MHFTVAIPTFNGEQRLPEVLEKLRSQVVPGSIDWEVLVIDNNSKDGTAQVVQAFQADFPVPLRYCLEMQQGSGHARNRAAQEASGELIGFLDDDNLPDANWVEAAYQFAQAHPQAGAVASRIRADLEGEAPPNFNQISAFLAITQRGDQALLYCPEKRLLPPTAGLVVRKQAWLRHVPAQPILIGRVTGDMLGGEDLEALTYIQQAGWEIWYNPAMQVTHKIPATRLEKDYLMRLFRGMGLSRFVTRTVGLPLAKQLLLFLVYLVNDLRKLVLYWLKHRTQLRTDLVVACQWQLLWNSLISPFYLWQKGYLRSPINPQKPSLTQALETQPTIDLSVVIPTFNGSTRLPLVLEKLRSQVTHSLNWEVIIIDNNSSDRTSEVVKAYQAEPDFPVAIRYFFEPRQGLAFARQTGVEVAIGAWVGFLDDDNLPDENWVEAAYIFAQNHPHVGAIASQIQGKFEVEPDSSIRPVLFYLAINQRGATPLKYQPSQQGVPPGAGLVCRRQVWLNHVPLNLLFKGRVGQLKIGAEDAEALTYLHQAGWEIWYNPAMKIEHLIAANRLERQYLIGLLQGVGLARHHLRMLMLKRWQRPFFFWLYLISDARKSIAYYYKNRSLLQTNTVVACEMNRLWSTLISPFYLFKLKVIQQFNFKA